MARAFAAIIGLALVGILGIYGMQAALSTAGKDIDITGESWTPDAGNVTELDHSNLDNTNYEEQVTVKDNNGDIVDPNVDYIWHSNNGTIFTVVGGALDGAPSATIDYTYEQSTEMQRTLASVQGDFFAALGLILPFLAVIVLVKIVRGG